MNRRGEVKVVSIMTDCEMISTYQHPEIINVFKHNKFNLNFKFSLTFDLHNLQQGQIQTVLVCLVSICVDWKQDNIPDTLHHKYSLDKYIYMNHLGFHQYTLRRVHYKNSQHWHQSHEYLSLIHIWRCRRSTLCRSRWSPYH